MEPPTPLGDKLRLLFSYGGHIVPRPHSTSLTYAGGDTKIISLHRPSLSLSSLTSHLSRTLPAPASFSIKYQLPGEDLDALVSVTTDEDLRNMLEEHDRLPPPARIRLFLFPARAESIGPGLLGPKSESWFSDALQGAMRRGVSADSGMLGLDFGGDVAAGGKVGAESMVMETGSSFGSTGSTVSMTNLPSIGAQGEENGGVEKRSKLPSSCSIESDNTTPSATSHQYTTTYLDPNIHPISTETMARPSPIEQTNVFQNPTSNFQVPKTLQAGAHQPSNQLHHQQELQYIQAGSQYIPQYSATPSYYPMYYPPLNQHTHNPYQQNQPYPVYYVPIRPPTQPYHTPVPPQHQIHHHAPTEVVSASATPLIQVPNNQNQQQLVDISDINHVNQPVVNSEFDDEFAYSQIYKTQPSGPTLISQYQTMTSGDTIK